MDQPTKRPPHGVGDREVLRDAQGKLALRGGHGDRTGAPRIFVRRGETLARCNFGVDRVRYSGLTPYGDKASAKAFAMGAFAVARAIHERLGPTAAALVMNGGGGIVRWRCVFASMTECQRAHLAMSVHGPRHPALGDTGLDLKGGSVADHDQD